MITNEEYQALFAGFEQCYLGKLSAWDRIEYVNILSGLNLKQCYSLLRQVARERTDNYIPTPNIIFQKRSIMFPEKLDSKEKVILDDCRACFSTGLIQCKKINQGSYLDEINYKHFFLCLCNNAFAEEKVLAIERVELIQWSNDLKKYYLPINRLVNEKYDGEYSKLMEAGIKKLSDYSLVDKDKDSEVIKKTNFKKIDLNVEINEVSSKKMLQIK